MRALVLGAGLQGSACAFDLLTRTDSRVTIADAASPGLPPFLDAAADGRLRVMQLDVRDAQATREAMAGHDVVLSAVPYFYNYDLTRLAIEARVHFADLGGNTDTVLKQLELTDAAKERGVTVIPDCGVAPGLINILAVETMGGLDRVDSLRLYAGGLPRHPQPPLNYAVAYSLEGVLDYYTTPSWVLENGRRSRVPALSGLEPVRFGPPLGGLEAFHTAGGLSTMPWKFEGQITSMAYKTLRYPGHASIMIAIRELGLLDDAPLPVAGQSVRPRDVFIAAAGSRLRSDDPRDVVAVRVIAAGGERTVALSMVDEYDARTGISAMMRTTGFSLSITGQFQAGGLAGPPGVRPAWEAVAFRPYADALEARGIVVTEDERT